MGPQVNMDAVYQRLQSLKPPASGPPDPVSKLWARHLSTEVLALQAGSGSPLPAGSVRPDQHSGSDLLRRRFPEYYEQYGYE